MDITLNDKAYKLRFNMAAMEMIEDSFGGIDGMYKQLRDKKKSVWAVVELIKIFINGARAERGERFVEHNWVAGHLMPWQIEGLRDTITQVLNEGMHAKTRDELNEEEVDETLEEIRKNAAGL